MRERLAADFERFRGGLPRDFVSHIRETYRIDLTARYLGETLPHPIGKGSGQLSLSVEQLEADARAGLAFVVLKTVIAEDPAGIRRMGAWAIHESRMRVERRQAASGREGWTVSWKGRGWDRSFEEYLALVRSARDISRTAGGMFTVPSVKYHLPRLDEPFDEAEYRFTTGALAAVWGPGPLLVEKDFSPTLAGDALADERAQVLRWVREVPERIRAAAPGGARVALKLMNSRFDDEFQLEMLAAAGSADWIVGFNRLYDPALEQAYGGWELSDRNLRMLSKRPAPLPPLTGTGNICSGRLIAEYARCGCESVQVHTIFQLPLSEYPATAGSRSERALHALLFDPREGLIAALLDYERDGLLPRVKGELRFLDLSRA